MESLLDIIKRNPTKERLQLVKIGRLLCCCDLMFRCIVEGLIVQRMEIGRELMDNKGLYSSPVALVA